MNDVSGNIDLEESLCKAEGIYLQLEQHPDIPDDVADILGLAPTPHNAELGLHLDTSETDGCDSASSGVQTPVSSIDMFTDSVHFNQFVGN